VPITTKSSGQIIARCFVNSDRSVYLLAGASAGGLADLFMSVLAGGVAGRAGAAPVVVPGWAFERGVTSRMPGGAAGGLAGWVCAVCAGGVVLAWLILVLFKP
jgi:hypothetical protein